MRRAVSSSLGFSVIEGEEERANSAQVKQLAANDQPLHMISSSESSPRPRRSLSPLPRRIDSAFPTSESLPPANGSERDPPLHGGDDSAPSDQMANWRQGPEGSEARDQRGVFAMYEDTIEGDERLNAEQEHEYCVDSPSELKARVFGTSSRSLTHPTRIVDT